ncbi:MAG TPA: hypothetical protein VLV15_08375 [Dongiaceae bacterium]|nr:hypothetical protein [Dongiaceae bacterium]
MRIRAVVFRIAVALGLLRPAVAWAGFPSDVPDRFQVQVGGTLAIMDTGAALGPKSGAVSAVLVFEDFFNIPIHKDFAQFEGTWRFGARHSLDAGYVNIDRVGQRQIDSDVSFGRYTFHAGATVEGRFASRFIYAAYRYDFFHEDRVRISGSAGISAERLVAGMSATGNITDENGQAVSGEASQEAKLPLPIPLLGLQLEWALAPRIALQSYSRYIALNYAGIRGSQTVSAVRLYWYFSRNLGIGTGFDKVAISMPQYRTGDYTARFDYNIQGWSFYLRGAF